VGETIKALIVVRDGHEVTEIELIATAGSAWRLQAPTSVEFREELVPHRHRQAAEVQAAPDLLGGHERGVN